MASRAVESTELFKVALSQNVVSVFDLIHFLKAKPHDLSCAGYLLVMNQSDSEKTFHLYICNCIQRLAAKLAGGLPPAALSSQHKVRP